MPRCIVFTRPDGGVSVCTPALSALRFMTRGGRVGSGLSLDDLYDFVLHRVGAVLGVRNTRSCLVLRDFKTCWGGGKGMTEADETPRPRPRKTATDSKK
jgi:hypothetical protein